MRGCFRGLPSIVFRTQGRRVMFMLTSAVVLCLAVPATRAIAQEALPTFLAAVAALVLLIAAWIRVEIFREEQGVVESDPTVQESRFHAYDSGGGGGGGGGRGGAILEQHGAIKLFTSEGLSGAEGGAAANYVGNRVRHSPNNSRPNSQARNRSGGAGGGAGDDETEFRAVPSSDNAA